MTSTTNSDTLSRHNRKRRRHPLSCTECRRRKLRCDRSDPCDRCTKSGVAELCRFAALSESSPKAPQARAVPRVGEEQSTPVLSAVVRPQDPTATSQSRRITQYMSPASTTQAESRPELASQRTKDFVNAVSKDHDDLSPKNDGLRNTGPMDNCWRGRDCKTLMYGRSHWSATLTQVTFTYMHV